MLYSKATDDIVCPLMGKDYSCIEDLDGFGLELLRSSSIPKPAIANSLPSMHCSNQGNIWFQRSLAKCKIHDCTLSYLCWKSGVAFRQWKEANRPHSGPLYDGRKQCKKDVKSYLNKCTARIEHKRIQKCDEMLQSNHPLSISWVNPVWQQCFAPKGRLKL